MLENNYQFLAEYIKSYANESALFNFRPSPWGQTTAWCSTKPTTYITGGNFCLGGETKVYDPVLGCERMVSEIDTDFHVLAWDGEKLVVAEASRPYVKCVDNLYKVQLASGETFVCSNNHRILTRHGVFQPLFDIDRGCDVFSPQRHNYSRITDIDFIRKDKIWDFEVYKYHNYYAGGAIHHNSGKTFLLLMMACGAVREHPHDKGWAYWPCMPGDDNLTADMRSKIRLKLPTNVWLSEPSRSMHRDITMGGWGRKDRLGLVEILGSRIGDVKWSDEAGVWDYVNVEPDGSRLTLKTAQAGPGAYAGPPVDMGLVDEPHNPAIVKEMIARVAKGGGKMTYACTPVISTTDMESYKQSWTNILWLKNEILAKGPSKTVDIITGMTVDENIGYTEEEKERKKEVLMTSGYSKDEQMTRLYGEIRLEGGVPFFDLDVIEYLMQFTREPDIGYLVLEDAS